jgi:transcriptional regulator with XRE-family HTH domain
MGQLATLFGRQVKALRLARGLSQAQLADMINVSDEWIRRIERGEGSPSLDTVEALAQAFQEDVSVLFGGKGSATMVPAPLLQEISQMDEAEIEWISAAVALLRNRPPIA